MLFCLADAADNAVVEAEANSDLQQQLQASLQEKTRLQKVRVTSSVCLSMYRNCVHVS